MTQQSQLEDLRSERPSTGDEDAADLLAGNQEEVARLQAEIADLQQQVCLRAVHVDAWQSPTYSPMAPMAGSRSVLGRSLQGWLITRSLSFSVCVGKCALM